jgi:ABC-type nitrate/sulfonate/bicarbonate transport system substrate-binding protein
MKVVIPDLVSNSYFPAIAAVEMGFFKEEGLDAELELIYPVDKCYQALRDKADFMRSFISLSGFLAGVKFIGALAQHTYWFLIMRADLKVKRGDLSCVKGRKIGAAPMIDIGLKELLKEAGIDPVRDNVQIAPPPMPAVPNVSFGVNAAKAMEEGKIDGFWANGMGAEVAVQRGTGTLVLDARRGDGPASLRGYTFGVLATRADLVEKTPDVAAAAVRALIKTQKALKADPKRATKVGEKWFPAFEASLIATLVERDLPYYDPAISKACSSMQVRADGLTGRRQTRRRGGDAVQQFMEGVTPPALTRS